MNIRIPLIVIVLVLFSLIELALLFEFATHGEADQKVIAFAGTAVGGAFALFVYLRGVEDKRSQAADKLFERWNQPAMAPYKDMGRDIRRGVIDPMTLARASQNSTFVDPIKTQRGDFLGLLSFFEEVSLSIRMRSSDEDKLKRFFEAVMVQCYTKAKPFIEKERNVDNEQGYYEEFEKVVQRWLRR